MECSNSLDSNDKLLINNCVNYGPIRYYRRRGVAPTLSTGRRSRYEKLSKEEQIQRDLRREKNRLLSKKLKLKRENIEKELLQQIKQLEEKEFYLKNSIEQLVLHKNNLVNKLEESKEDPLIKLINHDDTKLFFQEYDHSSSDSMSSCEYIDDQQLSIEDYFHMYL